MTMTAARRPFGLSLLSILLIVVGIFDLIAGIVLLHAQRRRSPERLA